MSLTQKTNNEINDFFINSPVINFSGVKKDTDDYRIKKRKISSDSLDTKSIPNVQAFLYETGLNAQLIDKNDKKLIKLNLNNKPRTFQYDLSSSNYDKSTNLLNTNLIEVYDLPSVSDISTGTTLILPKLLKHGNFTESSAKNDQSETITVNNNENLKSGNLISY